MESQDFWYANSFQKKVYQYFDQIHFGAFPSHLKEYSPYRKGKEMRKIFFKQRKGIKYNECVWMKIRECVCVCVCVCEMEKDRK